MIDLPSRLRYLARGVAARYVGVSPDVFDEEVNDGYWRKMADGQIQEIESLLLVPSPTGLPWAHIVILPAPGMLNVRSRRSKAICGATCAGPL